MRTRADASRVFRPTNEEQVVRTGAILCTTPVVAAGATVVERAIGGVAEASCRQGE